MPLLVKKGDGTDAYIKGTGAATLGDGFVAEHTETNSAAIAASVDGVEALLTTIDADTGAVATSVANVDTKTPALGQALAAASVPVVLPATQITTLTPPAAITGFATAANQSTLIGHVDGIEALLTTLGGYLDGLEALLAAATPAGTNNIGDVDIASIAAGDNNIGNVDIVTVPTDPFGATADAAVAAGATGSLSAKLRAISRDLVANIVLAAGTNRIGTVGSDDGFVEVTPTLDTNAYSSGDTLFAATQVASVPVSSGRTVVLESITVVDKDDQGIAFDIHFFDRSVTFGTLNAAPSISDSDAAFSMGHVSIASTDYKDLGGARVACVKGIGLQMKPNATDLYIGGVTGGSPTHSASGLVIKMAFLRS